MFFRPLRPRQPISATALQGLDLLVERTKPALGSGAGGGRVSSVGGAGISVLTSEIFLARITATDGAGRKAEYSFTEQLIRGFQDEPDQGEVIDRLSPREADLENGSPARWAGWESGDLGVDDLVLARRSLGNANEWEIVGVVAGGSPLRYGRVTAKSGSGSGATYTATLVDPATGADLSPTQTVTGIRRPPSRTSGDVYPPDIETNGKTFKFFTTDGDEGWIFTDATGSYKEDTFVMVWTWEIDDTVSPCEVIPLTQKTITVRSWDMDITEGSEVSVP